MIVLLRGFLKKCVSEIQKKLSDRETCLGVLSEVQGLLRAVGEKEAMQESKKSNDSLDGLDLSGHLIKLKTTHEFVESQAAKAVVGQTIY